MKKHSPSPLPTTSKVITPRRRTQKASKSDNQIFWSAVIIGLSLLLMQFQILRLEWEDEESVTRIHLEKNEKLLRNVFPNLISVSLMTPFSDFEKKSSFLSLKEYERQRGGGGKGQNITVKFEEEEDGKKEDGQKGNEDVEMHPPLTEDEIHEELKIKNLITKNANGQIGIHILCWRRALSLQRLLNSLKSAWYPTKDVMLYFHVDGEPHKDVVSIVQTFYWPYGTFNIDLQEKPKGIVEQMLQSWKPQNDDDLALFLEDDIELSPYFFLYMEWCRNFLQANNNPKLAGCSMYTPRIDEVSYNKSNVEDDLLTPHPFKASNLLSEDQKLFYLQLPCSWGGVYLGKHWNNFLQYYQTRTNNCFEKFVHLKSNLWEKSWKKYFIEFMVVEGLFFVYPNFENETSFSTNHYETGIHSFAPWHEPEIPNILREDKDERFTTPLIDSSNVFSFLPTTAIEIQNYNFSYINVFHELTTLEEITKFSEELKEKLNSQC